MTILKRLTDFTVVGEWDGTGDAPTGMRLTVNGAGQREVLMQADNKAYIAFAGGLPVGSYVLEGWLFNEGGDGPKASEAVEVIKRAPNAVVKISIVVE